MAMNKGLVLVKVLKTGALYAYPSCSICHKKVRKINDQKERLWCSFCLKFYSQKTVRYRYHVNLTVSDGNEIARVTVFGKSLEAFFGLPATEFCRYVTKCGQKNFLQGLNLNSMVHLAVERCFVGEFVNLAFRFTGNKSSPHYLQANVLPAMKPSDNCKIPELLANGICRIQDEMKHKSVADGFNEYIAHFERKVETDSLKTPNNNTTENCVNYFASKENINSFNEKDCDIDDVVSPRRLLNGNSHVNILMLSMMSSGNESEIKVEDSFVPTFRNLRRSARCERDQVYTGMESNRSKAVISVGGRMHTDHENLSLTDLQQSLCCTSNEDEPYVLTSIKRDKHDSDFLNTDGGKLSKSLSEEGSNTVCRYSNTVDPCSMSGIQSDVLKVDDIPWDGISSETTSVATCHLQQDRCTDNNANSSTSKYDMMFDSPTSEDLDIFRTQVSLTWQSEKSNYDENTHCPVDAMESNSSSNSNAIHLGHERKTCFTSTPRPSLDNNICHESIINCTYSPIYSNSITTPRGRIFCDTKKNKFAGVGEVREMFTPPEKPRSGKSECVSNCLCPSISVETNRKKSSCKQPFKGRQKSRHLFRCVTSIEKAKRRSKHIPRMKNSINVSSEGDQAALKPLNVSPDISSPYMPSIRHATFIEKSIERSLLLFDNEGNVDESENDVPVTQTVCSEGSQVRAKDPNSFSVNRDIDCLKDDIFKEDSFVTCASPLLFSP